MAHMIEVNDARYEQLARNAAKRGTTVDAYIDEALERAALPVYTSIWEMDEALGVPPEMSARAFLESVEELRQDGIEVDESDADLQRARHILAGVQSPHA